MDEKIKVTDKRMFTPEGELRETAGPDSEDSATADRGAPGPEENAPGAAAPGAKGGPDPDTPDTTDTPDTPDTGETARADARVDGPAPDASRNQARENLGARKGDFPAPTFIDLVGLLAQPIAMFLGDAKLPGGEAEENLPLARFHIDLLELVESKTKGNISSEEAKLLEDLLYQLRMRYLEKVG